jgi:hypothetical protein
LLLLALAISGAVIDLNDVIKYGDQHGTLFSNLVTLLINVGLSVTLVLTLFKFNWARVALIAFLYLFLANHVLSIIMNANAGYHLVALGLIVAVLWYVHMSESLKRSFSRETHNQSLEPTADGDR